MGKTPLFRALKRALHPSRREILRGTLAGLALAPLAPLAGCGDNAAPPDAPIVPAPTIAIVGGGVAGLHAAYQLQLHGLSAKVYEAAGRTGGRMFSMHGLFPNGQVCDLGGELIDTAHSTIQHLAEVFSLQLDDLHGEEAADSLASDTFRMGGVVLQESDLVTWFTPVAAKMSAAAAAADTDDAEFARIDALSIPEWLEQEAGLASTDVFRKLLELAYLGEYGLEVSQQSAWNLIYLMNFDAPDPFEIFGESDEAFHLHDGSQSVPDALAGALVPGAIQLSHALIAAKAKAGGGTTLTFETDPSGTTVDVDADHVIFAIPFTTLRKCELSGLALPDDKSTVIHQLGYGTNAKLMSGYSTRVWRTHGSGGTAITDEGLLQATWDTSRGQTGPTGLLVDFVGGDRGIAIGQGTAEERMTEALPWVEALFPGAAAAYMAGSAVRQHWPSSPFVLGSYACYKQGQTSFSGMEGARVGNLHFARRALLAGFPGLHGGRRRDRRDGRGRDPRRSGHRARRAVAIDARDQADPAAGQLPRVARRAALRSAPVATFRWAAAPLTRASGSRSSTRSRRRR